MKFKIGDKIVPKNGEWTCLNASRGKAAYAVITDYTHTFLPGYGRVWSYDLYDKDGLVVGDCWGCQKDNNSKLKEKTMDNLEIGDILVSPYDSQIKVLEVLTNTVLLSQSADHEETDEWLTVTELKNSGYRLKSDTPTELTMDEIANKFGLDVNNLKIKKD